MLNTRILLRYVTASVFFLFLIYFLKPLSGTSRRPIQAVKSSFDWSTLPLKNPVQSIKALPTGNLPQLPRIQYEFPASSELDKEDSRRNVVRNVFRKSWRSYKQHAWLHDELMPISLDTKDNFGGWSATLIDTLDTLWIMDLKDEFHEAVAAVATVDWANTTSKSCNMFETTIRHLGGLLSAYDLSNEPVLLDKAVELGDMLYAGFDTPNRLPPFWLDFEKAKMGELEADDHEPSTSPASLSLEFTRLAQTTGNHKYYDAIAKVTEMLDMHQNTTKLPGMWPTFFDLRTYVRMEGHSFTLGALADSVYEYLPKMHVLLGGLEPVYEKLYRHASETMRRHLLFRPMLPDNADILFSGTVEVGDRKQGVMLNPEGQHLSCFVGGMFGLAGRLFDLQEHVDLGMRLTNGCIWAYNAFPSGIMPEIFGMIPCNSTDGCEWDQERWETARSKAEDKSRTIPRGFANARNPSYSLRPEAIESVFILYRITGKTELQDAAWTMFQNIQMETETEFANSAIQDVTTIKSLKSDSMESFWLCETLKYFYLIFSPPDLISLDDYVFNTEAHPFKRPERPPLQNQTTSEEAQNATRLSI